MAIGNKEKTNHQSLFKLTSVWLVIDQGFSLMMCQQELSRPRSIKLKIHELVERAIKNKYSLMKGEAIFLVVCLSKANVTNLPHAMAGCKP